MIVQAWAVRLAPSPWERAGVRSWAVWSVAFRIGESRAYALRDAVLNSEQSVHECDATKAKWIDKPLVPKNVSVNKR